MVRALCCLLAVSVVCEIACPATAQEIIDPEQAKADPDFAVQGEYAGKGSLPDGNGGKLGAQVIALGEGKFDAVIYEGGLPGNGWTRGDRQFTLSGQREDGVTKLSGENLSAEIAERKMTITYSDSERPIRLKRTERKSPALGAKPPQGAVVLFDGTNVEHFGDATLTEMKTLQAGCTAKSKFRMKKLHLEFRLSYKPTARGQGRSNSGVYLGGCPEIQVLDSFGLEGRKNECGALYGRREPDVNMCLPPLVWQTFDVEFTAAESDESGNSVGRPRITVLHNGVPIHADHEVSGQPAEPRGIHLQSHGNRVQYRNIWVEQEQEAKQQ
ncbi:MAG: DUF1080 domain-containing protein [Candidatus Nealsonbacteria bacterium]|nr:DUF1080 domain-containing protein [Candidatus Nealsonbacteria bacterium]